MSRTRDLSFGGQSILCLGVKIGCIVALVQLLRKFAERTVDYSPALDRRTAGNQIGPALNVFIVSNLKKLCAPVEPAFGKAAIPGPNGYVSDRILVSRYILALGQPPVQDIKQALGLHRKPVDRIFDLRRGIGIKMSETAADIGRASHLPEQP